MRNFKPISKADAVMCKNLNVEFEGDMGKLQYNNTSLGPPCQTSVMKGDGNCFFRAISHVISGSEENHRKFRLAVVKYMKHNEDSCMRALRDEHTHTVVFQIMLNCQKLD